MSVTPNNLGRWKGFGGDLDRPPAPAPMRPVFDELTNIVDQAKDVGYQQAILDLLDVLNSDGVSLFSRSGVISDMEKKHDKFRKGLSL